MGTTNYGTQILSFDFREEGISKGFNRLNYQLTPQGVYAGGAFTRVNDTTITVAPILCFFYDDTNKVGVRVETTENASITVSNSTYYIVGRFTWVDALDNYMDILAVTSPLATDLIFGRLLFEGTSLSTEFDYSTKSWASNCYYYSQTSLSNIRPFFVTPEEPYSASVNVGTGKIILDGTYINKSTSSTIALDFPISANGRTDIIAIDKTGTAVVIKGADSPGAPIPVVETIYFPVAIIRIPFGATSVRGSFIEYINTSFAITFYSTPISILNKIITVDGTGSNLDADLIDGYHGSITNVASTAVIRDANKDIFARRITSDIETGTSPFIIASTTINTNLNSDLLDGYHAGNSTGQIPVSNTTVCTDLNADLLDGYHASTSSDANTVARRNSSANLYANAFYSNSSITMKNDVSIFNEKALDLLKEVGVFSYNYKNDINKNKHIGFLAEKTNSLLSGKNKDSMDLNNCIGILIKAVQELNEKLDFKEDKKHNGSFTIRM